MLHTIGLVLLPLAGYSAGSALGAGKKKVSPGLGDLAVMIVLWALAFTVGAGLAKWQGVLAALAGGLLAGAVIAAVRPGIPDPRAHLGYGEEEAAPAPGLLNAWRRFAFAMGNFQGRMVMAFFYFGVVTPFALISRFVADPQDSAPAGSHWLPRAPLKADLAQSRNQF